MTAHARTAPAMWAVVELRRRWRALVVLGVMAGVTAGLAMAAVVGARRTGSAWERLRSVTLASDAMVFASQVGLYSDEELDYDHIAGLPYVKAAGAFGIAYAAEGELFMASYGPWLETVDRPRIIQGRSPNPDDPTEVVVSAPGPRALGERAPPSLGERFTLTFLTRAQQLENRLDPPEGPTVTFRVVGISDSPFEIGAIPSHGDVFVGPAFRERYGNGVASFSNLAVRLADPARDLERLEAEVARHYPGRKVPVYDLSAASKRVTNGTSLERSGLLLFAAAVALAGLVIVGQALRRSVRAAGADMLVLVAIGFTRRDAARALALPYLLTAAMATVVSVAVAIVLSPRFPIGLGRRVDPDLGVHVDTSVLAPAAIVFSGVLALAVAAAAWRAALGVDEDMAVRPSKAISFLTRLGAPVVAVAGVRLALERGRGRRDLPTGPAILAAVFGVLSSVGAFTIGTGIGDAVEHGERFGSVWDVEAYFLADEPNEAFRSIPGALAADGATTAVARVAREQLPIGDVVLPIYAVDEVKGSVEFVVLEGSPPRRPGDVVLGPDSAKRLDLDVGDDLTLGDGERFRVVGTGLLPTTPHSSFDQGAWVRAEDMALALPAGGAGSATSLFDRGFVAARLAEGADVEAAVARITASAGDGFFVDRPLPPADQQNLRNVRGLPVLFAAFATALAVGALAHVLGSVLRRRRLDLAVLRSLGCTPLQVRGCLAWQAITLAGIGLVVGVPSGVALGRTAWRLVTQATPMVYVEPVNALALVLVVPLAVLLASVIAAWPGQRAAKMPLAPALRAE